ncbi:MFS transporter [bacterium]|nr:MFS transporter [bacterium]
MKRSPLVIILMSVFIALVGFGIVIPLIPVYAERYGASGMEVGLLIMIYSLMQFIFAPIAGRLSDRIGRRPVIIAALLLTSASYVLFAMADSLLMLFVSRALAGLGGADITVAQAYIADVTPPEKRARGMGLFGAAFGVGFIIGPALTALTVPIAEWMPPIIAAVLAGGTSIFALFALPEPERHRERGPRNILPSSGISRTLLIIFGFNFIIVFTQSMLQSMVVLFNVHQFNWSEMENGAFLAMIGVVAASIQGGLIGKLAKRFGERGLVRYGLLIAATGLFLISRAGSVWFLIGGAAVNAIGFAVMLPSMSSLVSRKSPADRQGQSLGTFQSTGSMARILAPVAGGFLYDTFQPTTPFFTGALIAFAAGFASFSLLGGKKWDEEEARENGEAEPV